MVEVRELISPCWIENWYTRYPCCNLTRSKRSTGNGEPGTALNGHDDLGIGRIWALAHYDQILVDGADNVMSQIVLNFVKLIG